MVSYDIKHPLLQILGSFTNTRNKTNGLSLTIQRKMLINTYLFWSDLILCLEVEIIPQMFIKR